MICVQLFVFCIAWGSSKTKASGGRTQTPGRSVRCHCARLLTNEEAWGGDERHQWWVSCMCVYMCECVYIHTFTHIYMAVLPVTEEKLPSGFLSTIQLVSWSCTLHSNLRQISKTVLLPTHEEAVMPSGLLTGNFYCCMSHRETLLRLLGGDLLCIKPSLTCSRLHVLSPVSEFCQ